MAIDKPLVTVITPVYCPNQHLLDMTEKLFLESMSRCSIKDKIEIVIVDDVSPKKDELQDIVKRADNDMGLNIRLIRNETTQGYGGSIQRGVQESNSKYILMSNNDIYVPSMTVERLVDGIDNLGVAAIGPVTNFAAGYKAQEIPDFIALSGFDDYAFRRIDRTADMLYKQRDGDMLEVNWLIGCFMMIRRDTFDNVGGIDTRYGLGYHEESDLLVRVRRKGYSAVADQGSFVYHGDGRPRTYFGPSMDSVRAKAMKSFIKNTFYFLAKNGVKETVSLLYDYNLRKTFPTV